MHISDRITIVLVFDVIVMLFFSNGQQFARLKKEQQRSWSLWSVLTVNTLQMFTMCHKKVDILIKRSKMRKSKDGSCLICLDKIVGKEI